MYATDKLSLSWLLKVYLQRLCWKQHHRKTLRNMVLLICCSGLLNRLKS